MRFANTTHRELTLNLKNQLLEGVPFSFIDYESQCIHLIRLLHDVNNIGPFTIRCVTSLYVVDIKNKNEILKAKGSNLVDDEDDDFDDDEDETDERNVDVHDEYDNNIEFSSNENNINYESDYRPSVSVAQLVKIWVLNI